jgi:hypothetical protein
MRKYSDVLTTILGIALGGLLAANVDPGKLVEGDKTEGAKALGSVLFVAYGWLTNKVNQQAKGGASDAVEKH